MKIGLYGGTFSPPHLGHIRAAKCFKEGGALDKLIIMPAGIPPHKAVKSPIAQDKRLELVRLAFSDIGEVSDYEMKNEGASYTYLTLRWLRETYDGNIFLCMGEDMFLSLDSWRESEEIFRECSILCLKRERSSFEDIEQKKNEFEDKYKARIKILTYSPLPVSSTEIRERIAKGETLNGLVSAEVEEYILSNGLYK